MTQHERVIGNIYEQDLDKGTANFASLSPIGFVERTASVFPDKAAIIHGGVITTYREFFERCVSLSSALAKRGIGVGDTVSVMAPNAPALLEAHFGVPMAGAVLNAINVRLDADSIAFILEHSEAKLLLTDREFSDVIGQAPSKLRKRPTVIDIDDPLFEGGEQVGEKGYEEFLKEGQSDHNWAFPIDEWKAISLNYTSGTTGNPKGVVYHHRGAYLEALGNALALGLNPDTVYLWTLPMFHCNGWTYPWAVTLVGGTHVCLRHVEPAAIFSLIKEHRVTHMCGAPILLNMLIHAPEENGKRFDHIVEVGTGGAAPPTSVIKDMEKMGFRLTHLYGLTESHGPVTFCTPRKEWDSLPLQDRAAKMARQGVGYPTMESVKVMDPNTLREVPADGETMGEIMMRGNTVMKGYLKNPSETRKAFLGGWFHSGDLAVLHPDGNIEIKDRSKDIIISGGENISSIEIEEALYRHPEVMEAAVVARPDEKWGETPCAFITLKPGADEVTGEDIINWCRSQIARYKVPRTVVFGPLPKTSTSKVQKFVLRDRAKTL